MAGFVWILHDFGKLSGDLVTVEKKTLGLRRRIHHIPEVPFAGLVLIPEAFSVTEPVRIDHSREQHRIELVLRKLLCLNVFRDSFLSICIFIRD